MFLSARPPELVRYWGRGAASLFLLGLLALRPGLALGFADEAARRAEIERTWAGSRQEIEAFVNDPDNRAAGEGRYYLQMWTNDLVRYAISKRIVAIRDPLLALYDKEFDTLTHATDYVFAYDPRAFGVSRARLALAQPADLWVSPNGEELVLSSSQFVWHLASVSRALIEANQASEPVVRPFLARALAVVTAHLKRWALSDKDRIFQRRGYGSQYGMYNHREFVQQLRLRAFSGASYSNAITDIDTWIIAAAAELIAAHRLLPGVAPLDNAAATALAVYVREATAMLSEFPASFSTQAGLTGIPITASPAIPALNFPQPRRPVPLAPAGTPATVAANRRFFCRFTKRAARRERPGPTPARSPLLREVSPLRSSRAT
jgi:hypothetical protein